MKIFRSNYFITIISIFFSLFLIELFFYFKNFKNSKFINNFDANKRYMLFQEGGVFQNKDKIFKYLPNKNILSKTYYNINGKWLEEYSYYFKTNNFGLVQNNDILKKKKSILFLGDSFVEGQGAEPWINKFNGSYKDFQIINGGILGTGPQQFKLLDDHISEHFIINKVIFFYIGDDLRRNIFNISQSSLNCLENHTKCSGKENFHGFPFDKKDPKSFLNFLKNERKKNNSISLYENVKKEIKSFFLNLYIVKIPNNLIKQKFYKSNNIYLKKNLDSINNLIQKYNNNIYFIQLKNKNEIIFGKEYDTFFAENFIKKNSKNHFVCNFDNEIENFHKIDMHPNSKGYDFLFYCVKNILKNNL